MNKFHRLPVAKPLAAMALLGGSLLIGSQASAALTSGTAANTGILNVVTLSYADAAGTAQANITASVQVNVALVASLPNITVSPSNAQTVAQGATATYTYTYSNTSNGVETFAISSSQSMSSGLSGYTANLDGTASNSTSITLGATTFLGIQGGGTTIAGGTTATTLIVPSDLTPDGSINGLVAGTATTGSLVTIGTTQYYVSAIGSDTAATDVADATTTITVTPVSSSAASQTAPAVGTLIQAYATVTLAVAPGTDSASTVAQTDTVTLATTSAQIAGVPNQVSTTTISALTMTVTKYVRNTTNAVAGTGLLSFNGNSYYTSGVTGKPGETLEYLIVVANTGTTSSSTKVIVSDSILNFITYTAGTLQMDGNATTACNGTMAAVTDSNSDTDQGAYSAGTVTFYPGLTGAGGTTPVGGKIGAGVTCHMLYHVTIN